MRRDMDLIRSILFEVEKQPVNQPWTARPLAGYSKNEVIYHVQLAEDQGLVDARIAPGSEDAVVLRLTNNGHEFLDAARSDAIWAKAKEMAKEATGTVTLQALTLALKKVIDRLMNS